MPQLASDAKLRLSAGTLPSDIFHFPHHRQCQASITVCTVGTQERGSRIRIYRLSINLSNYLSIEYLKLIPIYVAWFKLIHFCNLLKFIHFCNLLHAYSQLLMTVMIGTKSLILARALCHVRSAHNGVSGTLSDTRYAVCRLIHGYTSLVSVLLPRLCLSLSSLFLSFFLLLSLSIFPYSCLLHSTILFHVSSWTSIHKHTGLSILGTPWHSM